MGKFLKWVFILVILGAAGWMGYKWYLARANASDAISLVPSDAIYFISTRDPIKSWKQISESRAWSYLQKNAYFSSLTASANSLDSMVRQNDLLFDLIGSRSLIASAHMTGPKQYDFLFIVDLAEASGITLLKEYITGFSAAGYSVSKEKYQGEDIIILRHRSDNSTMYISLPDTHLLVSYTKKIVTSALDTRKQMSATTETPFKAMNESLMDADIVQLYFNYTRLPEFISCYSDGTNEYATQFSKTLENSILAIDVNQELISARGYTSVNESTESYIKTLAVSGKGATEILEIAPQRTGFYVGFGFNTFDEFFRNFEKNLKEDVSEYKTYRANLKQVEDYLKISMQENFISWIGDEVALFELQSSGQGLDNEVALVLKAGNIELAKMNLAYVEKMVRRRTPVKFKTVEHRGHKINYLSIKGLFKVLLGKFFARYDKPYYTIVDNFVIFSNHPQTLESIIDDYLEKKTLMKSDDFRRFRSRFEDEGSVFVYVNTPVLFNTLKKLADAPTRASMVTNKEFIVCFNQVGFQLVPETGRFKTILAEQFEEPEEPKPLLGQLSSPEESDSIPAEVSEVENGQLPTYSDPMALPYLYIQNLNAKSLTGYFPDSTVNFAVDLRNGFKNGSFTEYHQNGKVKMKGHFKNDMRDGTWRLFDDTGKLLLRRNYEGDKITKEKAKD